MSDISEKRVVEMEFDNKQFEEGVKDSIDSINELNESLSKDIGTDSFDGLTNSIKNCTSFIEDLGSGLGDTIKQFTEFEVLGTSIEQIFDKISNAVRGFASDMIIGSIGSGFSEYQTYIDAFQTIQAGSRHEFKLDQAYDLTKAKDVADKEAAIAKQTSTIADSLNELNKYADLTIYNFTQMTSAIGKFTSAGVELDPSVKAVKGISNLAAMAGATSAQNDSAMYAISQALSAKKMTARQWQILETARMNTSEFQEVLKTVGKHKGKKIDEKKSFKESLASGWLTDEVLIEALQIYGGGLTADQLAESKHGVKGYNSDEIAYFIQLGETASKAATQVKTFSQLIDTLKEAGQSGWTNSWIRIIGDIEYAKKNFTEIKDIMSPWFDNSAANRNSILDKWIELGGRDSMWEGIKNGLQAISGAIRSVKLGFKDAFGAITGEGLAKASEKFKSFTETLKSLFGYTTMVKNEFTGVEEEQFVIGTLSEKIRNIISAISVYATASIRAIKSGIKLIVPSLEALSPLLDTILTISSGIGKVFTLMTNLIFKKIDSVDGKLPIFDKIKSKLSGISEAVEKFVHKYVAKIERFIDKVSRLGFAKAWEWLEGLISRSSEKGAAFIKTLDNVLAKLAPVYNFVKEIYANIADTIHTEIGEAGGFFPWLIDMIQEVTASAFEFLKSVPKKVINFIGEMVDAFKHGGFSNVFSVLKENFLTTVTDMIDGFKERWIGPNFEGMIDDLFAKMFPKLDLLEKREKKSINGIKEVAFSENGEPPKLRYYDKLRMIVSKVFENIAEGIRGWMNTIKGYVVSAATSIWAFVKSKWPGIKAWFTDIGKSAWDLVKGWWPDIRSALTSVLSGAWNLVKSAWSGIWTSMWESIYGTYDDIDNPHIAKIIANHVAKSFGIENLLYKNVNPKDLTVGQKIAQVLQYALQVAYNKLQPVVQDMWNAFTRTNVGKIFADVLYTVESIGRVAYNVISSIISGVQDFFNSGEKVETNGGIVAFFHKLLEVMESVESYLEHSGIYKTIRTITTLALNAAVKVISFLVSNVPKVIDFIRTIASIVGPVVSTVYSGLKFLYDSIVSIVNFFKKNKKTIFGNLENSSSWISKLIDKVTDLSSKAKSFFSNTSKKFDKFLRKFDLSDFIENVKEKLEDVKDAIVEKATDWYNAGKEFVENFKKGFNEKFGFVTDLFRKIFDNVKSSEWYKVASNIWDGFKNGIADKFKGVIDKVVGFFSRIVQAVKDFLGIHSPSTVFYEIALFSGEGYSNGLESTWARIKTAISNLFTNIKNWVVEKSSAVWNWFSGTKVGQAVVPFFADLWKDIKTAASWIWDSNFGVAIRNWFSGVWEGVLDFFDEIKNRPEGMSIFEFIWLKVKDGWNKFTTRASEIWNQVKTWSVNLYTKIATWFENGGKEQVKKIAIAIVSAISSIVVAIKSLGIINAIGNFAKSFKNISQGLKAQMKGKVDSIGTTMLKIAGSIALLAAAVIILAKMDWNDVLKGMGIIAALGAELAILGIVYKSSGVNGDSFFKMALGLAAMTVPILILGNMKPDKIEKSLMYMALLFAELAGFSWLVDGSKDFGLGLAALAAGISVLSIAVRILGNMDVDKAKKGLLFVGILMAEMAVFTRVGGDINLSGMLGFSLAIGVLVGATFILGTMDGAKVKKGLAAIGGLVAGMAIFAVSLKALKGKDLLVGLGLIATFGVALAGFTAALVVVQSFGVQSILDFAEGFAIAIGTMVVSIAILSLLGPAVASGILAFDAIIAGIGALFLGIGKLVEMIDSKNGSGTVMTLIQKASDVLVAMGEAIGAFLISVVGGIASGLPQIGSDLSSFGTNLSPFIAAMKEINLSAVEGAGLLSAMLLAISSAELSTALSGFFTGGNPVEKYHDDIIKVADTLLEFDQKMSGLSENTNIQFASTVANSLADTIRKLPTESLWSRLTKVPASEQFNKDVVNVANALKTFKAQIGDQFTDSIDVTSMNNAIEIAKGIAGISKAIEPTGGKWQWFSGERDFSGFVDDIGPFADAMDAYATRLGSFSKKISDTTNGNVISVATSLADLSNSVGKTGGVWQWFIGENNFSGFIQDIVPFVNAMVTYSKTINDPANKIDEIDSENNKRAITVAGALADLSKKIPRYGGIWQKLAGVSDLSEFGGKFGGFASGLVKYSKIINDPANKIEELDSENNTKAITVAGALADLSKKIPKDGGMWQKLAGVQDLSDFGGTFKGFAAGLIAYATEISKWNTSETGTVTDKQIAQSTAAAKGVAEISNILTEYGESNLGVANKIESLELFGNTFEGFSVGLAAYSKNIAGFASGENGQADANDIAAANLAMNGVAEVARFLITHKAYTKANKVDPLSLFGANFESFATNVGLYGRKVKGFAGSGEYADADDRKVANEIFTGLAELAVKLTENSVYTSANDVDPLSEFSSNFGSFAEALVLFSTKVNGFASLSSDTDRKSAIQTLTDFGAFVGTLNADRRKYTSFNLFSGSLETFSTNFSTFCTNMVGVFEDLASVVSTTNSAIEITKNMNAFATSLTEDQGAIETLYNAIVNGGTDSGWSYLVAVGEKMSDFGEYFSEFTLSVGDAEATSRNFQILMDTVTSIGKLTQEQGGNIASFEEIYGDISSFQELSFFAGELSRIVNEFYGGVHLTEDQKSSGLLQAVANIIASFAQFLQLPTEKLEEPVAILKAFVEALVNDVDSEFVLTPVINMDEVRKSAEEIRGLVGEAKQLTPIRAQKTAAGISYANGTQFDPTSIINEIQAVENKLGELQTAMSSIQVVLNTGTLVGALAPRVDKALYDRYVFAKRGT